jgi:hypothetical protein
VEDAMNGTSTAEWTVAVRRAWTEDEPWAVSETRGEAGQIVFDDGVKSTEGTFRLTGQYSHAPGHAEITSALLLDTCDGGGEPERADFGVSTGRLDSECRVLWSVFEPCQVAVLHSRACMEKQNEVGWLVNGTPL